MLVGPNGAGKSTFLGLASGMLEPTTGAAYIQGAAAGTIEARAALSYLPDNPVLYDDLSLMEHIEFVARLHRTVEWEDYADDLLDMFGLTDRADDLPSRFSRGLKQKTGLILGLIRPFRLMLIDEPFVGLDTPGQETLVEVLSDVVEQGATVVCSTHQLDLVAGCDALRRPPRRGAGLRRAGHRGEDPRARRRLSPTWNRTRRRTGTASCPIRSTSTAPSPAFAGPHRTRRGPARAPGDGARRPPLGGRRGLHQAGGDPARRRGPRSSPSASSTAPSSSTVSGSPWSPLAPFPRAEEPGGRRRAPSPCPVRPPASPGPAASWSRAVTTPSSSRRCGATTCASKASSSSCSTEPTTSTRSSAASGRGPGTPSGHPARPPGHGLQGEPDRRRHRSSRRVDHRTSLRRHLGGGEAVGGGDRSLARPCPRGDRGRKACARSSAWTTHAGSGPASWRR